MMDEKIEKLNIRIGTKEEAFWETKKDLSKRMVAALEQDLEDIPRLIKFHKEIMRLCDKKIKEEKR